ncbi:MAG: hypothetical protein DHS20C16_13790 [Phycisphaerae bacterium]|nr:MAG: hypothetical protein DHS20C16_13790 [Phycisphaerae bacterium]
MCDYNTRYRFYHRIGVTFCGLSIVMCATVGCINSSDGGSNATAFSDLLDDLVSNSPTTSDNNGNEPTSDDTGGAGAGDADSGAGDIHSAAEALVLELVNEERAKGADCGSAGSFEPAGPLTANGVLAEIARAHSSDMAERNFFDHTNPDGDGPGERIEASTYEWSTWGENIAAGYRTPEAVVEGWMNSDGHCSNIMNPAFSEIGVGYESEGSNWTQVFGAPR